LGGEVGGAIAVARAIDDCVAADNTARFSLCRWA